MLFDFASLQEKQGLVALLGQNTPCPAYIVGGVVRDALLQRDSADLDLVFEGDALAVGTQWVAQWGGELHPHPRFGTAQWRLPPHLIIGRTHFLDLITARRESYPYPAALPHVQPSALRDDLARRDFTLNTLAVRLDGESAGQLHDPFGGVEDLREGWVRVLHRQSFRDDPTRLFRAIRYTKRMGFRLSAETAHWFEQGVEGVALLSGVRVRHELERIFAEPNWVTMMQTLHNTGLLAQLSAEWSPTTTPPPQTGEPAWLWWLAQQSTTCWPHLALTHKEQKIIADYHQLYPQLSRTPLSPLSQAVFLVESVRPHPATWQLLAHALPQHRAWLTQDWSQKKPQRNGDDLIALGVRDGRTIRALLHQLRAGWIDGIIDSAESEFAFLQEQRNKPP